MGISPKGLDHLVLRTADVGRLADFYCRVLGCVREREVTTLGLTQLRAGASLIDLVDAAGEIGRMGGAAPGGEALNLDHFCLRIDPWDEPAIRTHLSEHGVEAGPTEQRYGAEGQGPSIYLSDPDGNTVELKGPPAS